MRLLCSFAATLLLAAGTVAAGQPRLFVEKEEWDFGVVWYGEPCETRLLIRNDGDAPLHISDVKTTCGCTPAKKPRSILQPGESDYIGISYNTRKGVQKVMQTLTIESNDPGTPKRMIPIRGTVKNVYEGVPTERVSFGQITLESKLTQVVELRNNLPEKVRLTLVPESTPGLDVQLETVTEGERYRVIVSTRPPLNVGSLSRKINLKTDHPRFTAIDVPVTAYVADRVSAMPPRVLVLPSQPAPIVRTVNINYLPDKPIKVVKVESNNDAVTATLLPTNVGAVGGTFASHTIRIEIRDLSKLPDVGAHVVVTTDDQEPRFQTFVIPIQKYVQPGSAKARGG